jgi:hypothetical protein
MPVAPAEPAAAPEHPTKPVPETIGRYLILQRLGGGGMGTVYKAHDPHLNRTVALKVPRIDTAPEERAKRIERFQREARSAAQVWHPHVCPIHDVGEHDGQPYVVMAYIQGQSLAERLAQRGRFEDIGEAVTLILQVIDALGAVHGHGIVHRDLKPSNIMLDADGRAILTDFGLALPENQAERLTSEGVIVGTPAYMAPEQAAGEAGRIGAWTDVYSAGVVFFEMLTGRRPFEGAPLAVLGKILHEPPPPLSQFRPYLDPRLEAILLKALDKQPEGRFASARQFRDAFTEVAIPARATVTWPQAPASGEQIPGPRSNPAEGRKYGISLHWGLYLTALALFVSAGVCFLIRILGNMDRGAEAANAFLGFGSIPAIVGGFLHWRRHRQLTSKNGLGETLLMTAARDGHASQVKRLLNCGAEPNDKDLSGQTALMKAAASGHTAVVKLLLANGAEVNEHDNEGQAALMKAKTAGRADIVVLLESAGARSGKDVSSR